MKIQINEIPVYYINLDREIERNTCISNLFKLLDFTNVTRFSAINSYPESYHVGCSMSHMAILKGELDKEVFTPFMIVEDDLDATKFFTPDRLLIDVPNDSDGVYLGISKHGVSGLAHTENWGIETTTVGKYNNLDNIHKIINMLGTTAILYLTREYALAAYNGQIKSINNQTLRAGDAAMGFYVNRGFNVYGLDYPLFYQNDDPRGLTESNDFIFDGMPVTEAIFATHVSIEDFNVLDMGTYIPEKKIN